MRYGVRMETFTDRLRTDLEHDEGVKYEIYLDHFHLPTFGIGHLVRKKDPESSMEVGDPISKERVESAFEEDIATTIKDCKRIFKAWDTLPEEAKFVTANMCFQLGGPRFTKFKKTISHCNNHKWVDMASEMRNSKWYTQTTARAERLIKRILDLDQT